MIMKQARLNPLKENVIGNCMRDAAFSLKSRKKTDPVKAVISEMVRR